MALFNFRNKDEVVDLSALYKKQQERAKRIKEDMESAKQDTALDLTKSNPQETSSSGIFSIFNGSTPSIPDSEPQSQEDYASVQERRRKLSKRLMDMTDKLEEISNQIYHLQQRLEVVERKLDVNRF